MATIAVSACALLIVASPAGAESVSTMRGCDAAGPARYDRVRLLKQGPAAARHVLVLEPGTSAGAAYFRPLAAQIVRRLHGWQVWSVERRENLLEDHSMLNRALAGKATIRRLFDYYLGWLSDPSITDHIHPVSADQAGFVRNWGMRVAVCDLHRVIAAARRGGHSVVLGGHSLGGTIATAYASWDFGGHAGAEGLDGLVFIDGIRTIAPLPSRAEATSQLADLQTSSPFRDLLGAGLPWTPGAFNAVGSTAALRAPKAPSILQAWPLLGANLKPPVPATNRGSYGYAFDTETSPASLALVQVHIGHLATSGPLRDWVNGELGRVQTVARMFSGIRGMDGTAWYHPQRLSLDAASVDLGNRNPAQRVFGVQATLGDRVDVPMYGFQTSLGRGRVLAAVRKLGRQSGVPRRELELVNRDRTYAHVDPLAASPRRNAFLKTVVPFLRRLG